MIFYSIGKRIKNFLKIKIFPFGVEGDSKSTGKSSVQYPQDNSEIIKLYFNNGEIKAECNYKNKMLEGISNHYYENGKIRARENYKEGQLEGLSKKYYSNGHLQSEEYYKRGKLLYKRIFDLEGDLTTEEQF